MSTTQMRVCVCCQSGPLLWTLYCSIDAQESWRPAHGGLSPLPQMGSATAAPAADGQAASASPERTTSSLGRRHATQRHEDRLHPEPLALPGASKGTTAASLSGTIW